MITAVNICGIPYNVKYVEDSFDADTHFGQINFGRAEIIVNKGLNSALTHETICHELVHGILIHLGYNDLSNNEQLVQALGNAIHQSCDVKNIGLVGCECNVNK